MKVQRNSAAVVSFPVQAQAEPEAAPARELWGISDFCAVYGVSRSACYDMLADGRLTGVKCGRLTLLENSSVQQWRAGLPKYEPDASARRYRKKAAQ